MKFFVHSNINLLLIGLLAVFLAGGGSANAAFIFGTPTNIGPTINSSSYDLGASISPNGLELFFSSDRIGGWGGQDLWRATRPTTLSPWGSPVNLGYAVNGSSHDIYPSISGDGLTLYFQSNRFGSLGFFDIYRATRASISSPWGTAVNLGSTVNSSASDGAPSITADGLSLFFCSLRGGGEGASDIWVTTRSSVPGSWGAPVNLGPLVNCSSDDYDSSVSPDGLILFFAAWLRHGGIGDNDIWVATRATTSDPWAGTVNLGPEVNTFYDEIAPYFYPDGSTLIFTSDRPGGSGGFDLWQVPLIIQVADLNGDGIVNMLDFAIFAENWLWEGSWQ